MICSVCGKDIDPTAPGVWQKVEGWERHRDAGGTNAIKLRRPLQEWIHPECMLKLERGLVNQEKLV